MAYLGIHDHVRLVPLFMIENLLIAFDLNSLKGIATQHMPNHNFLSKFFGDLFCKECLFPIEIVVVARANPTKIMHDVCGPSPSPLSLDAAL